MDQLSFLPSPPTEELRQKASAILRETLDFDEMGSATLVHDLPLDPEHTVALPCCTNEFWTSKQRQANRLHEISYRACFKPQLPAYFIDRLTEPGDVVFDPFMGRGTTPIEAALRGRVPAGSDVNPLSLIMTSPRLTPPTQAAVEERLAEIPFDNPAPDIRADLEVFYHADTLRELSALRDWLLARDKTGKLEPVDRWIRMVAINRLTGHSNGFFSVYTLPPNQAASVDNQKRINAKRNQVPPYRDVREIIARKSKILLSQMKGDVPENLSRVEKKARLFNERADDVKSLKSGSVDLIVTSPPFVDVVNYARDNWLRCWFAGVDITKVRITQMSSLKSWTEYMERALKEMRRVTRKGGHIAVEVGEIRKKSIQLENVILPLGIKVGLAPILVMINEQNFTKTAQLWGVDNNKKGTNSNRIVLFRKD